MVTNSDRIASLARSLRNQGRGEGDEWLWHVRLGYNYRLDEMSSALGAAQLARLPSLLTKRARVAQMYTRALSTIEGVRSPRIAASTTSMSWFVYVVLLAKGIDRDSVVRRLKELGVETRPYFVPIHCQPYIREMIGDVGSSLPVTSDIGSRSLALPFHSGLSRDGVEYVVDALRRSLAIAA